jgi:hypothetical protein
MEPARARALAERLHAGEREPSGRLLLDHIRRVVAETPAEAHTVAWLHEALETGATSERRLLEEGVTSDQLRAVRLLTVSFPTRSDVAYLGRVALIAHAAGRSGLLARMVKVADVRDRLRHPQRRRNGWTPPYARALGLLLGDEATPAHEIALGGNAER